MLTYFFGMEVLTGTCRAPRTGRAAERYAHVCLRALDARNEAAMESIGGGSADTQAAPRTPRRSASTAKAKKSDGGEDGDGEPEPDLARLVNTLIERIAALSKPSIPIEHDLWSVTEIAAYFKRSESVVRERIVCVPSFPVAIRLPKY